MIYYGPGYCDAGYYAGWDNVGTKSQEACNGVCLSEQECTYAAWWPNITCSRYNQTTCTLNSNAYHVTYSKQSMEFLESYYFI